MKQIATYFHLFLAAGKAGRISFVGLPVATTLTSVFTVKRQSAMTS